MRIRRWRWPPIAALAFFLLTVIAEAANQCYSCASENMRENFLSRSRGPQKRIRLPKLFDDNCDLDTWLIREKSIVSCESPCFKWQQIVNNSGVYSYATIRSCYSDMFEMTHPLTSTPAPSHMECTKTVRKLECLDQSTVIEDHCWCSSNMCNAASTVPLHRWVIAVALLTGISNWLRWD